MAGETIGVDIGHGVNTFPPNKGVYVNGVGYAEHDFNAKTGIELVNLLEHNGFKTAMIQKPFEDEVPLSERTDYYNSLGVDLVWSIHANANSNDEVEGRCAFYWYTSEAAQRLAELYAEECNNAGYATHGNGLHASQPGSWTNLHICRETEMTAVLTENGFMTNDEPGTDDDFELLFGSKQEEYVKEMARVHARAICRFYGQEFIDLDGTTVASTPQKQEPKPVSQPKEENDVYTGNSIVTYLNSIKVDSSFSNRAKLAKQYGIKNYKGTPDQNLRLLEYLRSGKDPGKGEYTGTSVVDYLNFHNRPSSFSARKDLAGEYGINNYRGTASQNLRLLKALRKGKKPKQNKQSKGTVHLPASAKTWGTYTLDVQPVSKNISWYLTPAAFGGLTYDILDEPYPNVVTIKTSRGKRNIYVGPNTSATVRR